MLPAFALARFSKHRHFTASQYFLPIKRIQLNFRTLRPACAATTSSDQVKIATLLFLSLLYTEAHSTTPLPNGNKLTTQAGGTPSFHAKHAQKPTLLIVKAPFSCTKFGVPRKVLLWITYL